VLGNIGGRIFFEQPARKNLRPAFGIIGARRTLAYDHLHKGAFILIGFPRRGALTGTDAQHHLAKAHRFAGLQLKIAGLAVAFVKQADHRHPLGHWRARLFTHLSDRSISAGGSLRLNLGFGFWHLAAASRQQQRRADHQAGEEPFHARSGLHAS
jgi:hypothetical protein